MKTSEVAYQARVEARIRKDERKRIAQSLLRFMDKTDTEILQDAALRQILRDMAKGGTGKG